MTLNPTPAEELCDAQGRPTFLWDNDSGISPVRGGGRCGAVEALAASSRLDAEPLLRLRRELVTRLLSNR